MLYELWDTQTGNLVGEYESEAAALAVVRGALSRYGPDVAAWLALGAEHDGEGGDDALLPTVLSGPELLARAQAGGDGAARRTA